jgi:hypothetical protein
MYLYNVLLAISTILYKLILKMEFDALISVSLLGPNTLSDLSVAFLAISESFLQQLFAHVLFILKPYLVGSAHMFDILCPVNGPGISSPLLFMSAYKCL